MLLASHVVAKCSTRQIRHAPFWSPFLETPETFRAYSGVKIPSVFHETIGFKSLCCWVSCIVHSECMRLWTVIFSLLSSRTCEKVIKALFIFCIVFAVMKLFTSQNVDTSFKMAAKDFNANKPL